MSQQVSAEKREAISSQSSINFDKAQGFTNFPQFCQVAHLFFFDLHDLPWEVGFEVPPMHLSIKACAAEEGLEQVTDFETLGLLQALLDKTHKSSDNWTRDRGCSLHGVNRCADKCVFRHRASVPTGFVLVKGFRNRNQNLWQRYCLFRAGTSARIQKESGSASAASSSSTDSSGCEQVSIVSAHDLSDPLERSCNEWRALHGTSETNARAICEMGFNLQHSGQGATWKQAGELKGTPLYGDGIYLAENITKADEYTRASTGKGEDSGLHAVLVTRVVGGRVNVVTEAHPEVEPLRRSHFEGKTDVVLGDRVVHIKKPYREVVAYDEDQVFPEYLLLYARQFGS